MELHTGKRVCASGDLAAFEIEIIIEYGHWEFNQLSTYGS